MRANQAIKRNCPNGYLWLYYTFCKDYARVPIDLQDLADGLSCLRARNEIEGIYNGE